MARRKAHKERPWTEDDFALSAREDVAAVSSFGATNYRSFREFDLDVGRLTVLAGPNGAGKSSIVDVPRFISDALSLSLYTALERRGGVRAVRHRSPTKPRNFGVRTSLSFGEDLRAVYKVRLQSTAGGDYAVAEETCDSFAGKRRISRFRVKNGVILDVPGGPRGLIVGTPEEIDNKTLGLPLFGGLPQLRPILQVLRDMRTYSIVPDKLRELQDPDEGFKLESDGRNAASVLRRLEATSRAELIEMLSYVVPGVTDVKTVTRGNKLTMQFTQGSKQATSFDALQVSDGTLRLLGLLLSLYQRKDPSFLAIEEPESTIHVAALQALVEVFRARSEHTQILLTTHSSEILDSLSLEELHLVDREGGISRLDSVSGDARVAIESALFSPGELLRTGSLASAD
jgi:predicted ATPase